MLENGGEAHYACAQAASLDWLDGMSCYVSTDMNGVFKASRVYTEEARELLNGRRRMAVRSTNPITSKQSALKKPF